MSEFAKNFKELYVYRNAMDSAMEIYELTKLFPNEEKYSMVDQMRRSSRSVCANLAEAWRKRRYKAAFVAKLSDVESEASETQVWLEIALRCNYISTETAQKLYDQFDKIISQIIKMINNSEKWLIKQ